MRRIAAWTLTLAIVVVSLLPGDQLPQSPMQYTDKLVHMAMYTALALAFRWAYGYNRRWMLIVPLVVGSMTEVAQHFVPMRSMSLGDMVANCIGIAFAYFLCMQFKWTKDNE